jgi:hypothetical protein
MMSTVIEVARALTAFTAFLLAVGLFRAVRRNHLSHRSIRWLLFAMGWVFTFLSMDMCLRLCMRAAAANNVILDVNSWLWVVMAVGLAIAVFVLALIWSQVPPPPKKGDVVE